MEGSRACLNLLLLKLAIPDRPELPLGLCWRPRGSDDDDGITDGGFKLVEVTRILIALKNFILITFCGLVILGSDFAKVTRI